MASYIHFTIVAIGILTRIAESHVYKSGTCPTVDVMENFDFSRFVGTWYVVEKFDTSSRCMTYNFGTIAGSNKKWVTENSQVLGIRLFGYEPRATQTSELIVPNPNTPAKMEVKFSMSMNPFSPATFHVYATDYETYAAVWSCRPFIIGHHQSAMIMSRQPTLDRQYINKLRTKLDYYGIDKNLFSIINQSNCNQPNITAVNVLPEEIFSSDIGKPNSVPTENSLTENMRKKLFGGPKIINFRPLNGDAEFV